MDNQAQEAQKTSRTFDQKDSIPWHILVKIPRQRSQRQYLKTIKKASHT